MDEVRNLSASGILHHIRHSQDIIMNTKLCIVTGKNGPTGKSWLTRELNEYGFNAIELSESIYPFVQYKDDDNHVIVNHWQDYVLIVLNRRLPQFV